MKKVMLPPLTVILIAGFVLAAAYPGLHEYQQERERIIAEMEGIIHDQAAAGNYRCCIEPPCTMCFLGNWIWDDGICRCDDMIAQGDFGSVCPQCKDQIGEGACQYSRGLIP